MAERWRVAWAGLALFVLWLPAGVVAQPAELVIVGADIPGQPDPRALAVAGGTIRWIGPAAEAGPFLGPRTRRLDLSGKLLLPGFIDNHVHVGEGGEVSCFVDDELSLEEQRAELAEAARGVPGGRWIIGYGGELEVVLDPEAARGLAPIETLDEVFPRHPVIIMERSSHSMFVNSLALARAGIDADSPDPAGGRLLRDESGELLGVLVDNAGDVVMELAVNSLPDKAERLREGIRYGLQQAAQRGLTTLGDGRTYWRRGMFEAWQAVERSGGLSARVSLRPWIYPTLSLEKQLPFLRRVHQDDSERLLIVNQVKLYSDGVPENGTARVGKPYADTLFPDAPRGINYIPEPAMRRWLQALDASGYGAHIHALGDLGVREALNAIAAAREAGSRRQYHITHIALLDPVDLPRFAELGVVADIQIGEALPTHEERMVGLLPVLGRERAEQLLCRPLRELHATGATVTLSSDWTVHPLSPLSAISLAVEEGSLDLATAIDAYTIHAARALGLDGLTGSIEVGKSADFVVLARDIRKLAPAEIRRTEVMLTMLRGEVVYERR